MLFCLRQVISSQINFFLLLYSSFLLLLLPFYKHYLLKKSTFVFVSHCRSMLCFASTSTNASIFADFCFHGVSHIRHANGSNQFCCFSCMFNFFGKERNAIELRCNVNTKHSMILKAYNILFIEVSRIYRRFGCAVVLVKKYTFRTCCKYLTLSYLQYAQLFFPAQSSTFLIWSGIQK